jgi:hypothetical protein
MAVRKALGSGHHATGVTPDAVGESECHRPLAYENVCTIC